MSAQIGYLALLRNNRPFRRLWYGQLVSQLGDWFNSIALFTLLLRLTGSGQAVSALLVAELLPALLIGPWAGVLVDRFSRKYVMIAADIGRALLVLMFLLVRDAGDIWIVYVATILKVALTTFFEPARSAMVPLVTSREELVAANGISGVTWSAMLALGAALGGLVTGTLGTDTAFLIDAGSYLLSAVFIVAIPFREAKRVTVEESNGAREFIEGFGFMFSRRDVLLYACTKAIWSMGGGILLLLTLFGREIFPLGVDGALSIGLLYAARGVGAGIGPLVVQRLGGSSISFLRRALGPAILMTGIGYVLLSGAPNLALAALAVGFAHLGGSVQWVFSSALLQMSVPNRLQGRIFAIEIALWTLTTAISSSIAGVMADSGWPTRTLALIFAAVFVPAGLGLAGLLWLEGRQGVDRRDG